MLERLVEFSVRRRGVILSLWAITALISILALRRLSIDAVPDVTNEQVSILTSAHGLSPVEVEQYLTYPIEMELNGLPGVSEIRSISRTAISSVTVIFQEGTNIWFARQLVSERMKIAATHIPPGYGQPELAPVSTGLGDIYEFYLTSKNHTPMELRTLLDWEVAYKLRSVPGVIEVNTMGGEAKQYHVVLDPYKLASHRLTIAQIQEVLERSNAAIGGGYIEKNQESFMIRGDSQYRNVEDIANTVVTVDRDGTPVLLKQIADVRIGAALRYGTVTRRDEGEIVAGTVMMLIGANSREVVHNVKHKLDEIQKELPAGVTIGSYYDRAEFINRMLKTVAINLGEGALLVVMVLFLTLGSLRAALIAALAIPLSMGFAVIGMVYFKVTGNLMSLGAIDFGLLVDGAIIMLELTLVELGRRRCANREDIAHEVAATMKRAARPVAFALTIIMLVYLPLMTLQGVEGKMFKPMAITVTLALLGALLFSLTAFPALAAALLRAPDHSHNAADGIFGFCRKKYLRALDWTLNRPRSTLAMAAGLLVIAGIAATRLGAEFIPRLDEGELILDISRLPSISITEAQRLGIQVEDVLRRFPEVISVVTRTGRGEVAVDPVGAEETDVMVKLKPKEEWTTAHDLDALGEKIKLAVETEVPATFVSITQPIEDRVDQLLAGARADVVIKVFGQDLVTLKETASTIGQALRNVPGTGDLRVQRVLGLPMIEVKADRLRLGRYGISADRILQVVEASRVGRFAGKIFEGQRRFDLMLLLPPGHLTPEGFGELLVGDDTGRLIPLAQVADVRETEGPAVVNREALSRRVLVEVNVRGRDLVGYVHDAQKTVKNQVKLPPGVTIKWGGQFENYSRASQRLVLVVPLALGIIFGMLFLMFGNVRYAAAVFAGVPFALVGGVAALLGRGLPFSISAAVGFIAVGGVAVLNGVVMASEIRRQLAVKPDADDPPDANYRTIWAFRHGAVAVLRPVLITALVAAIGFLPMALSTRAGAEVQRPLATVVIGGIISSTLLLLVVLPAALRLLLTRRDPNS